MGFCDTYDIKEGLGLSMEKSKVLLIDTCISIRTDSRTRKLSDTFLKKFQSCASELGRELEIEVFEARDTTVEPLNVDSLKKREELTASQNYQDSMFDLAKQFSKADYVIISAPYWDLSFPASLKVYVENIVVSGITFQSTENGLEGLCRAKKLFYLTTAGGIIGNRNFGYDYFKGLAEMLGIDATQCYYADGLDLVQFNSNEIMERVVNEIESLNMNDIF